MASKLELVRKRGSMRDRLIVALDVDSLEQAKQLVQLLAGEVGMFKIGKQLFTHAGPQAVHLIQSLGGEIFLDLKFHDIPNTVAKASIEATRLGVKMFNVHASGSLEMMRTTVKEVERVCRGTASNRSSMLRDVEEARPTEIGFINGAVVRLGRERGTLAPANLALAALVEAIAARSEGACP